MDAFVLLAVTLANVQSIVTAAIGLGLVIFFHELGHFAVAKWCNVQVERFSIGFGPILLQKKYGETEYALSLIPFGGYVKMLGQDDADPSQMTDTDLEANPRSYTSKTVPQRMAIISAGVIMNVITGLLFFMLAFRSGVHVPPPIIGDAAIGQPAWQAGLKTGDTIEKINGREISTFMDIVRASALSGGEPLKLEGKTAEGTPFDKTVTPRLGESQTRMQIGAEPSVSITLPKPADKDSHPVAPGTPAAEANPTFDGGDRIVGIDDQQIENYAQLREYLAEHRRDAVTFKVHRDGAAKGEVVDIKVAPRPFHTLGFAPLMGKIESIQDGSPAQKSNLQVGDTIIRINGQSVGTELNPLHLPGWFADHQGETVELSIQREEPGKAAKEMTISITPIKRGGWLEAPRDKNVPLSIPAIGIAYHMMSTVSKVDEDGPAAEKLKAGDRITKIELISTDFQKSSKNSKEPKDRESFAVKEGERNLGVAFWILQQLTKPKVNLTVTTAEGQEKTVEIEPIADKEWFQPNRGIQLQNLSIEQKGENLSEAWTMAVSHTRNSAAEIYMTLSSLISQKLSIKELHGPFGIAKVAYVVAEQGFADFLMFLGFLSINLAVLNFLPIPVLDGGHMVFLIWEGVTGRKPSEKVQAAAIYIGMAFVLSLMMLVIYLDIFHHKLFSGGN